MIYSQILILNNIMYYSMVFLNLKNKIKYDKIIKIISNIFLI